MKTQKYAKTQQVSVTLSGFLWANIWLGLITLDTKTIF